MVEPSIPERRRRLHPAAAPLALGVLGLLGAVVVHVVDPNVPGRYPVCPWLTVTGTYCPGCGTTRALHALTYFDIVGAAQMNLLLLAVLPFLAFAYVRWVYRSFRRRPRLPHRPRRSIRSGRGPCPEPSSSSGWCATSPSRPSSPPAGSPRRSCRNRVPSTTVGAAAAGRHRNSGKPSVCPRKTAKSGTGVRKSPGMDTIGTYGGSERSHSQ